MPRTAILTRAEPRADRPVPDRRRGARAAGVTEFDGYAVEPAAPLALDFFLDDKGPHVKRVVSLPGSADG